MRKFLYIVILTVFSFFSKEMIAQPLNANAGPDENICVGDTVTLGGILSAIGGTGTYTYNWSNGSSSPRSSSFSSALMGRASA